MLMVVEMGLHLRFSALKLRPRFCTAIALTEALTYYSVLAQLVEQLTVNQRVAGSSPADGAISCKVHWLRPCCAGLKLDEIKVVEFCADLGPTSAENFIATKLDSKRYSRTWKLSFRVRQLPGVLPKGRTLPASSPTSRRSYQEQTRE
jgi:hypothetical protein